MKRSHVLKLAFMAVLVVSMFLVPAHAAVTCQQVTFWLTPCISYGVMGGIVAPGCCSGIKALNDVLSSSAPLSTAQTKCRQMSLKDGVCTKCRQNMAKSTLEDHRDFIPHEATLSTTGTNPHYKVALTPSDMKTC
ncbi:hypothetical protein Ddye_026550 [Dipteronia dyeriana]|uniref:Uncharacterized protein n=1 Tax=Dipteronia dyeriana TaxID=168575 RepID=A0AAD9TNG7_9ROSI|nr:hypothetical protein Ddye_026550 [Dipteronia dyeriana]